MEQRTRKAQNVTWVGFFTNLILSLFKLAAGIFGHSAAMIADAVHSISDFATDVIVVAFVRVSYKESDTDHRYGHGKFETFAAMLISMALLFVGLGIFLSGAKSIYNSFFSGMPLEKPSLIALFAAVASIVLKEWLFQYTIGVGKSIDNQAVIANAWHHRSDALSSIGAMLGIGGAIFFGDQWRILDPLAGMVVSVLIAWVAIKMGIPTVKELTESALPEEIENEIIDIIHNAPGVKDYHRLKTRKIGSDYAIDVHVKMDGDLSLTASHDIATGIENQLYDRFGRGTHISIHTEPYLGKLKKER